MTQQQDALFQRVWDDDLVIGVDGSNEKSVIIVLERHTHPLVKTARHVGAEYVVVLSHNQFLQCDLVEVE